MYIAQIIGSSLARPTPSEESTLNASKQLVEVNGPKPHFQNKNSQEAKAWEKSDGLIMSDLRKDTSMKLSNYQPNKSGFSVSMASGSENKGNEGQTREDGLHSWGHVVSSWFKERGPINHVPQKQKLVNSMNEDPKEIINYGLYKLPYF
ncbi:hypothetical protein PSTG_12068 [Puccinia striiformis f. sp. tritici PST-78]|uniref:Uncharacterized protein n=1 Tax=Puccinia striiformis f. sp. tritici PST-78 TaxID=1165861 RepID=A0A0L0V5M5_9BASI|nr:hypothetical protein PSTG_12068 [Puccinia striiformis f. sp. tritici PST-78]